MEKVVLMTPGLEVRECGVGAGEGRGQRAPERKYGRNSLPLALINADP